MNKIVNYLNTNIKPKSKKGLILGISFGLILPITLGAVLGVVLNKFFIGKNADYSNINEKDLAVDINTIMQKYQYCNENSVAYSEVLKPYEMVNVAYNLYAQHEHSQSYVIGSVDASMVTQSIRGTTIRDGDNYFEESLSTSDSNMVNVAKRIYMDNTDVINFHNGYATTATTADFEDVHYEYNKEEYKETFGRTLDEPLIYVVSKKSILANSDSVTKQGDNYIVNLDLHPLKGVVRYVKQMKNISNLGDYPAFDSVSMSFVLGSDLLIKELTVNEAYFARTSAGIGSDIDAVVKYLYYVDGSYSIPRLNENIVYPEVAL